MADTERSERKTVHIPRDLTRRVKQHANRLDRSFSWVLCRALRRGLEEVEQLPTMNRSQPEAAE